MNTEIFSNIDRALNNIDDTFIAGKKSENQITQAEKLLNIHFPNSYKQFLTQYGNISFGHIEIYGLTKSEKPEIAGIPNVVGYNIKKWKKDNFPKNLLIFQNDNDQYSCLNLKEKNSYGENPIVIWDVINKCKDRTLDMNFDTYLLDTLNEYIEDFC